MLRLALALALTLALALALAGFAVLGLAGCFGEERQAGTDRAPAKTVPARRSAPADKSVDVPQPPADSSSAPPATNAEPAYHLDPDPLDPNPAPRARPRRARIVELVLRSTPSGANASVDGQPVGKTPTFWHGSTDGRPREFTFALPGYGVARYRFVPAQNGVVHGTLRRLVTQPPDAGPPTP